MNVVFKSALWTSGDIYKALRLVYYGASMTVSVLIFVKTVMMQDGGASKSEILEILQKAKIDLPNEMKQMQQKQERIDERAANEYAEMSASAQKWIEKVETALQTSGWELASCFDS